MNNGDKRETDLIIIGAGLAGLAAACFAAGRGLETTVVAWSRGEIPLASGVLDLLGIYPVEEKKEWDNPWDGVERLIHDHPEHPYARFGREVMKKAWTEFEAHLADTGLDYCGFPESNCSLVTASGTKKTTFRVPRSMWPGVMALRDKRPCLMVDFDGMKDYHGVQVVEVMKGKWPGIEAFRVGFPHRFPGKDRHNLLLAEALDSPDVRAALAEILRPKVGGFDFVGFPAILGTRQTQAVVSDLERMLGVPVFEIPTLPPSVPGQRLMTALDQLLIRKGVNLLLGRRVLRIQTDSNRCTGVVLGDDKSQEILKARAIILAGGRFIGGGLTAGLGCIREALLDLPVHQPKTREEWHRDDFLDPRGHLVNRSGIPIDERSRPLGKDGRFAFENLFAAGSILAHQDWVREKCGAGLALTSAYGALEAMP